MRIFVSIFAVMALGSAGCATYSTAVVSTNGKAYVSAQKTLNQTMYHCDATSGKPVCTELNEQ